jgi:methionyl-tRNA formyltransferase
MRIIFAGTPSAALPSLTALATSPHTIAAVVTRPDAPQGRKRLLRPSPVATIAQNLGLPVVKTARLDAAATALLASLKPDLGVIVAYGGLVRNPLLTLPQNGWINLHFSLLPRWRGAAPVQRAIMAGDELTGATVFRLVPELDAGSIFETMTTPIGVDETAGQLLNRLAHDSAPMLLSAIDAIETGNITVRVQKGDVTYAPKLEVDDARTNWSQPANAVYAPSQGSNTRTRCMGGAAPDQRCIPTAQNIIGTFRTVRDSPFRGCNHPC